MGVLTDIIGEGGVKDEIAGMRKKGRSAGGSDAAAGMPGPSGDPAPAEDPIAKKRADRAKDGDKKKRGGVLSRLVGMRR